MRIDGFLAALAGVVAGAICCSVFFILLTTIPGGEADFAFRVTLAVADVAVIVLTIFLVARRGQVRFAPFLLGLAITFAGFLTACFLLVLGLSTSI
jgi:hypothetical protein